MIKIQSQGAFIFTELTIAIAKHKLLLLNQI